PGGGVLDARVTPLLLDHPPDAVEVVVELGIARVEWDRLALDARPPFATAAGATGATATERLADVGCRWLGFGHGRHPRGRARRRRVARRLRGSGRLAGRRLGRLRRGRGHARQFARRRLGGGGRRGPRASAPPGPRPR